MTRARVGYAAMLEQFTPTEILDLAAAAEQHGFDGVMAADHFQPWTPQQGQASFVWNVLSALGQTTRGALGTVSTPTYRMHPAVVAQASATLESMYPGRHWLGLGSGEALNEHVAGQYWPDAPERIDRMFEAVEIIRKLFASGVTGKDTRHEGRYYRLESTRLWTSPATPPPIYIAASGPVTAKRAGRVADGIITETAPHDRLSTLFQRFDEGARESGRRSTGERILRVHVSWAPTDEEATRHALEQWPTLGLKFPKADIRSPFEIEQMARMVTPAHFEGRLHISADPDAHRAYLQGFLDLGVDRIHLHNVGRNQREFLEVFGRDVLPGLTR